MQIVLLCNLLIVFVIGMKHAKVMNNYNNACIHVHMHNIDHDQVWLPVAEGYICPHDP